MESIEYFSEHRMLFIIDAYEGVHLNVRSGSHFKFTWMKNRIRPADDTTEMMRERYELGEEPFDLSESKHLCVHYLCRVALELHLRMAVRPLEKRRVAMPGKIGNRLLVHPAMQER